MTSKEGAERWQAKRGTVAERNKYMFNNPLLSDIKFSFPGNDKIIPAHKYVLAVSSSVFFAMFYGDLAETRDTILTSLTVIQILFSAFCVTYIAMKRFLKTQTVLLN